MLVLKFKLCGYNYNDGRKLSYVVIFKFKISLNITIGNITIVSI